MISLNNEIGWIESLKKVGSVVNTEKFGISKPPIGGGETAPCLLSWRGSLSRRRKAAMVFYWMDSFSDFLLVGEVQFIGDREQGGDSLLLMI